MVGEMKTGRLTDETDVFVSCEKEERLRTK